MSLAMLQETFSKHENYRNLVSLLMCEASIHRCDSYESINNVHYNNGMYAITIEI